jgi:hypothetical protein
LIKWNDLKSTDFGHTQNKKTSLNDSEPVKLLVWGALGGWAETGNGASARKRKARISAIVRLFLFIVTSSLRPVAWLEEWHRVFAGLSSSIESQMQSAVNHCAGYDCAG